MITQEFKLNMIPESDPVVVHVNQCDQGIGRLIAHLYHKGNPYTPSEATVIIQGTKPDKHGFGYDASISGNTVTANLTEQMTAVPGSVRTQFVVTDGYGVTGTFAFILEVQASALDADTDTSETEIPGIIDAARQSAMQAATSAAAALVSEQHAKTSEDNAKGSEEAAATSESNSEAWAVGQRNGTDVQDTDPTYHNNSKYYAGRAASSETAAGNSATSAASSKSDAEAWAVGQRNGTDVQDTDPTYHNNSKYYAGRAASSETAAGNSATSAASSKEDAEAWAVGQRNGQNVPSTDPTYENNAEYWARIAEQAAAHGGHTIKDGDDDTYTNRTNLKFDNGSVVVDDEDDDTTVIYPALLTTYMGIANDWFAMILDDDGHPIISDDDYAILADWKYKYV